MPDESVPSQNGPFALVPPRPVANPVPPKDRRGGMESVNTDLFTDWMRSFAHWLSQHPRAKVIEQVKEATLLSGVQQNRRSVSFLRSRKDFQAYYALMSTSNLDRAAHTFKKDAEFYAHAHRFGLELAMAKEDHRAIPAYTTPVLDRIAPKRAEKVDEEQKPTIVINLTASQAKSLALPDPTEIVIENPEVVS